MRDSGDGAKSELKVAKEDAGGLLSLLDEVWGPTFAVPPHFHEKHTEVFYILSGQIEWTVGGEKHEMKAGDSVIIPPSVVHSTRVLGGKEAHTLMFYSPGGYEDHQRREATYTKEQLNDPQIKATLRKLNDFHPSESPAK